MKKLVPTDIQYTKIDKKTGDETQSHRRILPLDIPGKNFSAYDCSDMTENEIDELVTAIKAHNEYRKEFMTDFKKLEEFASFEQPLKFRFFIVDQAEEV